MTGSSKGSVALLPFRRTCAAILGCGLLAAGTPATVHAGAAAAAPGSAPPQVVFILPGQSVGTVPYLLMEAALEKSGYDARILDLDGTDVRADARVLARSVDRVTAEHPGATVSLVGHSAGGMSARSYLKSHHGSATVANYVAIGSPQYGSPSACLQGGTAADLCPGSAFLTDLNEGDDTPGSTRYVSIRSSREWADGRLDGGQCRVTPIEPPSPLLNGGFHHSVEPVQPEVITAVATALSGHCAGEYVDEPDGAIRARDTIFRDGL